MVWLGVIMSQQQFQAEVMDELKMQDVEFTDRLQEILNEVYIRGWQRGMQDAADIYEDKENDNRN